MFSTNSALRLVAFLSAALTAATQDFSVVSLRVSKIAADGSIKVFATSPISISSFRFDLVGGIGKALSRHRVLRVCPVCNTHFSPLLSLSLSKKIKNAYKWTKQRINSSRPLGCRSLLSPFFPDENDLRMDF